MARTVGRGRGLAGWPTARSGASLRPPAPDRRSDRAAGARQNGPVTRTTNWTVIVPVKDTAVGKSRLRLPAEHRRSIALAMAADTVAAVATLARVLVVVETDADAVELSQLDGVTAYRTPVRGLNDAVLDGLGGGIQLDAPIGVLPGDLPGLSAADLAAALDVAAEHRFSAVADREGTGTTLLAALRSAWLLPRYGPDSFARHLAAGAHPIASPMDSTLRGDIDLPEHLRGRLGPRTRAALAVAGLPDGSPAGPVVAAKPC